MILDQYGNALPELVRHPSPPRAGRYLLDDPGDRSATIIVRMIRTQKYLSAAGGTVSA